MFLRVFQLGKHSEEKRCNRYNYTYLAISRCLVVSLHQILVAFASFSIESGSDKPNKYLCENISSAIRAMEGKQTIGMLIQYYYQVISKSDQVIQVCGSTLFNQKYILLHELYLELPQDMSSTSCITIHSKVNASFTDSMLESRELVKLGRLSGDDLDLSLATTRYELHILHHNSFEGHTGL